MSKILFSKDHSAAHPSKCMSTESPGHVVHLNQIGGDHSTARDRSEQMWNKYYFKTYSYVVGQMLGAKRGTLLDVGTSRGNWFKLWKRKGFHPILGVELDSHRAQLAKEIGYDEVYNCDAMEIPLCANTVDVAVSNDVFVHILELDRKIAVLREIERILKPDGIFILNHSMSMAYGFPSHQTLGYCSFLSLHELLTLVIESTGFQITDIKPTYYNFRGGASVLTRLTRRLMFIPFAPTLHFALDYLHSRSLPLEQSDTVYLSLHKEPDSPPKEGMEETPDAKSH